MSILTGNVIKDEVEAVVKLKLFWISKVIFKAVWWAYPWAWPGQSFSWKIQISYKVWSHWKNALTNNIIAVNIAGVTDNVLAKLLRMETMRRDVRRQIATHAAYPPIPNDGDTLFDIPQRFTVTSTETSF